MSKFNNILSFEDFISEQLWSKGIKRSKSNSERLEDVLGDHVFTDGNGTEHKHGVKITNSYHFTQTALKIIEKRKSNSIDLNVLDMSYINDVNILFSLLKNHCESIFDDLIFNTSGWIFNNCNNFDYCLKDIKHDIGVENWKGESLDKVKLNAFSHSYYMSHIPNWYKFDIKEYVKLCSNHLSYNKYGVDKELTKKLGKKSYWVIFNESVKFEFIPDNVVIKEITNLKSKRCNIDASNLTSLEKLPKKFINTTEFGYSGYYLHINCNNIIDDEIIIPDGITYLNVNKDDNIKKLPKELNCSIALYNKHQLGHITDVNGNFNCCNSNINSLSGCPTNIQGDFDAHNCHIIDLTGSPKFVNGDFTCSNNKKLNSLKGCSNTVINGSFHFFSTSITNIDDFPKHVGKNIEMSGCTHLKNFIGLPKKVNGFLDISYCNTESLEGLPEEGTIIIKKLTLNNKEVTKQDILNMYPKLTVKLDRYVME